MRSRSSTPALIIGALLLSTARPAAAAGIRATDIAADSELVLHEQVGYGTYHDYTVAIRVQGRRATLVAERDGVRRTTHLPMKTVLSLWTRLLHQNLDELADASPARRLPDQSEFRVEYRARQASGAFSAYAVDVLPDVRYRRIVRDLLQVADTHVKPRWDARQAKEAR